DSHATCSSCAACAAVVFIIGERSGYSTFSGSVGESIIFSAFCYSFSFWTTVGPYAEGEDYSRSEDCGGASCYTFSRCNFRVEDSQRLEGKVVVFDFHNVIDRYYWAPRVGQRKQQYKIPYPNEAPELLSDVQGLLRRVHRAAEEAGALVVICSHIGEGSRSIEDWALDTLRNTFIQSVGQRQADLVIITRSRTGRLGKLDICRRLFQQPSLLIIDDNTGICEEWNRSANAAAFHIQLPRRDLPSIGRSFSSIFEA
ncbi:unnamed protein product, partial [Symbiodinium sp. CCMP2592]